MITLSSNGKEIVCSIRSLVEGGEIHWKRYASHIVELAVEVNVEFFEGCLTLESSRSEEIGVGGEFTRSAKPLSAQSEAVVDGGNDDKAEGDKIDAPASEILSFLTQTCKIDVEKA